MPMTSVLPTNKNLERKCTASLKTGADFCLWPMNIVTALSREDVQVTQMRKITYFLIAGIVLIITIVIISNSNAKLGDTNFITSEEDAIEHLKQVPRFIENMEYYKTQYTDVGIVVEKVAKEGKYKLFRILIVDKAEANAIITAISVRSDGMVANDLIDGVFRLPENYGNYD